MGNIPSVTETYTLSKIKDRGGDLSKRWYVEFYIYDVFYDKKVRVQDTSFNHIKSAPEHRANPERIKKALYKAADNLAKLIDANLLNGGFRDSTPDNSTYYITYKLQDQTALVKAIEVIFREKEEISKSKKSKAAFRSFRNITHQWLSETQLLMLPINRLNYTTAKWYMDWYKARPNPRTGKPISNAAYNGQLMRWRSFFNELVTRDILKKNYCRKVPYLKVLESGHIPYTDDKVKIITQKLNEENPQLMLFCSCIYYMFIRITELRLAQVKNIRGNKWQIPGKIEYEGEEIKVSKNGYNEHVIIPAHFRRSLEQSGILTYPDEYFIFGRKGIPSEKPAGSNFWNMLYKKLVLNPLGITTGETLYSWKHTGICRLYMKFRDIEMIRKACRHRDIKTTIIYLRNLGMFDNDELEQGFPEL